MPATVHPIRSTGLLNGFSQNNKPNNETFRYALTSESGLEGPDQILPSDNDTTTKIDGHVRIPLGNEALTSTPPISIPSLLKKVAKTYPNQIALVSRRGPDGQKTIYTYEEYEAQVRIVAKAFIKLGLERHHGVCILGFNCPQWLITNLAAIYAGGIATGVYTTNSPQACQYCIMKSEANIVVVEDANQLEKVLQIKKDLPNVKAIIQYEGIPKEKGVLNWNDILEIGEKESDDKLNEILKTMAINQCCTIVYTSGTVGNPKAVMLSHDNILHSTRCAIAEMNFEECKESLISFLPLSHIAAQEVDIYISISTAATVHFADKDALKGSLIKTMQEVRPTVFMAVPRVWEKIYENMQAVAVNNGPIKNWIANWAKAQGLYYNMNKMNGIDYKHWGYVFAKWLVFGKVKTTLSLDRCKQFVTVAAPLNTDIKKYFMSLDILIMDVFGMSECAGGHTLSTREKFRLGSVGVTMSGLRTKLDNLDGSGEGEICIGGRHVFMGYLNEPEKTADCKDEDGWLHSGDMGRIDEDGFVYITGRIKELIITAGGENIPPVQIEHMVLAELPALNNAFLIGDRRKYLTILVTLKTNVNSDTGEPLDTLTTETLKWAKSIGSKAKTVTEIIETGDPLIYKEIDEAIKRANQKAISNAQKVQKFRILPHDFSIATGELGPTLKLKRNVVIKMYESLIEEMYQ